jgi:hypothetical protein
MNQKSDGRLLVTTNARRQDTVSLPTSLEARLQCNDVRSTSEPDRGKT